MADKPTEKKTLAENRRARHDYFVEETVEAGVVLQGSEVKSLRDARVQISDAYAMVRNGEAWLINLNISEYPWANRWNHAPKRDRKLLLHKREIEKLDTATTQKGYTILPLEVYLSKGKVKILLGVCKGKQVHDKRHDAREKQAKRDVEAALKRR